MTMFNIAALWTVLSVNLFLTLNLLARYRQLEGSPPGYPMPEVGPPVGAPAPAFSLDLLDGSKITNEPRENGTCLVFVSEGCKHCISALPAIQDLALDARSRGFDVVLVDTGGADIQETAEFAGRLDIRTPMANAGRGHHSLTSDYSITATPSFCAITSDGLVAVSGLIPSTEWDEVHANLSRLPALQ